MIIRNTGWINQLVWPVLIADFYGQVLESNNLLDAIFGLENTLDSNIINIIPNIQKYWVLYVESSGQNNVFYYEFNEIMYLLSFSEIEDQDSILISFINVQRIEHGHHIDSTFKSFDTDFPSLIYVVNIKGQLIYANNKFHKTIERYKDETFFDKESEVWQNTLKIQKASKALSFKEAIKTKYGCRQYLSQKFPIYNNQQLIVAIGCVSIDITKFLLSTNDSEILFSTFNNLSDAVAVTNADLKLVYVNQSFVDTTGYSVEESIGNKPSIVSSDRHTKDFYGQIWQNIKKYGYWEGEIWNRRRSGEIYLTLTKIYAIKENERILYYVAIGSDISERRVRLDEIEQYAYHDILTGLYNRYYFESIVAKHIEKGHRKKQKFALVFLDLDHFKEVNDIYGHQMGDRLLVGVANRLQELVRKEDLVSRLGGDEFLLYFDNMTLENVIKKASKIVEYIGSPYEINGYDLVVESSVGIAIYPDDALDFDNLLKYADAAMYKAKELGRNRYCVYNKEISEKVIRGLNIKQAIKDAFDNNEYIEVLFQPQVNTKSQTIHGVEILSRINHPELGLLTPGDFISELTESNKMPYFDMIVLQKACQQITSNELLHKLDFRISQNITVPVIMSKDYCERFVDIIKAYEINTSRFSFEVIENIAIDDYKMAYDNFNFLKGLGISVEIDDFGAGYSSLSYLVKFPISILKIDAYFVQNIDKLKERKICQAIISLADSLELGVIGEGVETQEQARVLEELGCYIHQGFLYSKPITISEILDTKSSFLINDLEYFL